MDLLFFIHTLPDAIYSLTVGPAVLLFLAFYITLIMAQARKVTVPQPVRLPVWLFWVTPMYPSWLDKLTLQHMLKAFIQALGIAIGLWIFLMAVLLIVLAKVYGP